MKKFILAVLLACVFLSACGQKGLVRGGDDASEDTFSIASSSAENSDSAETEMADDNSMEDTSGTSSSSGSPAEEKGQKEKTSSSAEVYVYLSGAVKYPGIYILKEGDRVYQAVEMAGGLTEDASSDSVNQARILEDGEMIHIPTKDEAAQDPSLSEASPQGDGSNASSLDSGKININTADEETLCTLPGIGESKAKAIISYREENGGFSSIEELTNISGIKEGVFSKIKDLICV